MTMKLKGLLFGKFLKQLFIISLISCFGLLGNSFVNAWTSYGDNGSTVRCNLYLDDVGEINGFSEGYNVNITNLGNLWTYSDLGNKNIFYVYSNFHRRMWAWIDGKLYHNSYTYYSTSLPASKLQGFVDKVKVVPSSCLDDYSCVSQFIDYSTGNIITNDEFSDLDLTFVKYGVFATNGQSNDCSVNPSFIFGGLVFLASDGNFYSVACQGGRDYPSYCPSGIITGSSLGLDSDLNYENLLNYTYSTSPFSSSSSGTGGQFNPTPGVEFKPCMTLREILALRPQYNEGLCYSSSSIYSGGSFVNITPKSIFDLFPTFNDFNSSMNKYQNYCSMLSSANTCASAFEGHESEYTLISKLPDNVKRQDLYNYCDKVLNYDLNISSCVASGGFQGLNPRSDLSGGDFMNGILNPTNPLVPSLSSGSALDYIRRTYYSGNLDDFISDPDVLEKIGNDALQLFPTKGVRGDYVGILPLYMVIGFIAILLLYFIRR